MRKPLITIRFSAAEIDYLAVLDRGDRGEMACISLL